MSTFTFINNRWVVYTNTSYLATKSGLIKSQFSSKIPVSSQKCDSCFFPAFRFVDILHVIFSQIKLHSPPNPHPLLFWVYLIVRFFNYFDIINFMKIREEYTNFKFQIPNFEWLANDVSKTIWRVVFSPVKHKNISFFFIFNRESDARDGDFEGKENKYEQNEGKSVTFNKMK